jgi:hypothetical protein
MSSPEQHDGNEQSVIHYLLGLAPEEEMERLDRLSITDDEFAVRLNTIENDLVDAYVRKELSGDMLKRFETFYLASPRRREKVRFAESFLAAVGQHPAAPAPRPARTWFALPRLALAAAACLLLLAGVYLLRENARLRAQVAHTQAEMAHLRVQLASPQPGAPTASAEIRRPSSSRAAMAFLLRSPTRAAGAPPAIALASGSEDAIFRLELEPDDFPAYQVALKDLEANRVVWRSGRLSSAPEGSVRAVSASLPAGLLKPQTYSLELTGIAAGGATELVGSYVFKVAAR